MPNISTLINRGNSKKLKRNKNTEHPNRNCIKKENCPTQGEIVKLCSVKAEVLNSSSNSNNRNDKKCMWVQSKVHLNKDITIVKVASLINVQLRMGSQKQIWYWSNIEIGKREKM